MLVNGFKQSTTTTGTGNITLATVTGFAPFSAKYSTGTNGDPIPYAIVRDSDGVGVEWGLGHLDTTTTFVRDKILATWDGATYVENAPSAVSLGAGPYTVMVADMSAIRPIAPVATDSALSSPRHLLGGQISANPGGSVGLTNGTAVLVPFRLDVCGVISGIATKVTTAATTGTTKNIRAALYAADKNGHPGNVIAESTAGVSASTTGTKALSFAAGVRLPAGWYFVAMLTDGNPNVAGSNSLAGGGICPLWGVPGGDPIGRYVYVSKSVTYADTGACFPSPFGTTSLTWGIDWTNAFPIPSLMVTS